MLAAPARPSADPYADAAAVVACPPGPSGWAVTGSGPDGRYVETPLTIDSPADPAAAVDDPEDGPTQLGGSAVEVDCNYRTAQGGRLNVFARYALPSDFNPFADFFVGCKSNTMGLGSPTGPQAWDNTNRLYRVVSDKAWAYAGFYDYYDQIQGSEVTAFESISNNMLKNAQTVAHNCNLSLQPTAPLTTWRFGFDATVKNGGITTKSSTTGSFTTRSNAAGGVGFLGGLQANNIVVDLERGSKKVGAVTISVTNPVSFTYSYGAELRALVKVASSTYAPCHVGATGTLTVSTNSATATLQVCHRNLFQGIGATNAHISD